MKDKPVFSVQYHPEASPGPHDAKYLFDDFIANVKMYKMGNELGNAALKKISK